MKRLRKALACGVALVFSAAACDREPVAPELSTASGLDAAQGRVAAKDASYTFAPPVFDIAAAPDGSILVAETVFALNEPTGGRSTSTIKEIRNGTVRTAVQVQTIEGSPINGLTTVGRRSFYATSGALDRAIGGKLFHVTQSGARVVADIGAFERNNDPDATVGPQWKDPRCEVAPFTPGPQSNPYHLTMLTGSTALVADAAGNTLLAVKRNGEIELVAVFTPPVKDGVDGASSDDPEDWLVLVELADGTDCFVQPVPTSAAIGPDGAYYVGELTGAAQGLPIGLSRVWRIEPGARNVVCPSEDCQVVISGLTSVIDVAFGPDGNLYVLEYDENSWLVVVPAANVPLALGTLSSCDVGTGDCDPVEKNLVLPGAITFDKWGDLWLLENNVAAPTVRWVDLS